MGKVIAVTNQKGGVGKTTSAVNLAAAMGKLGKKTLLVDIDPQGNATSGFGISKKDVKGSCYELLISNAKVSEVIIKSQFKNVDVIPSSMNLAAAEIELADFGNRTTRLKQELATIKPNYDYIFIDCPPSLGLITINALNASDTILIPIQCEYYALEGLSQLMATVRQVKRLYNPQIEIEGVLLTMYDARLNLTMQVVNEVKKFFPQKVYSSVVPRNVRLSEAPSFGQPICYFDSTSKGAKAYDDLSKEIIDNNK